MFEKVVLEAEQVDLLSVMVEMVRNSPRDQRGKFVCSQTSRGDLLTYVGQPRRTIQTFIGDLEVLTREGLIDRTYSTNGTPNFNVLPQGFAYYTHAKLQGGQSMEKVEDEIKHHLSAEDFRKKYSVAFEKWGAAETLLWSGDSEQQLTTIGHYCREAIQGFATSLINALGPADADANQAHDVNRVRAVIESQASRLGKTERPFLVALIDYWEAVSELVQRQEHGGQREATPLVWEDARRIVFQTAIVMFEVDRALGQ